MAQFSLGLLIESLLVVLLAAVIYYCHRVYRGLHRIESLEVKKIALESALSAQISQAQTIRLELGALVEEAHAQSRARLVRVEDSPALVPSSGRQVRDQVRDTMLAAQSLRQRRIQREAVSHAA